ncbi:hypothetical protein evm_011565 [Chilo suppressalis]|nr:hypothetical protein evm_011565 [Chilo suppressalis]
MNNFEENTCRICLQNKDTLFSLFRKIKGSSPYEKLLNKTKLQLNVVCGPSSICSQCLMELDTTVNFLDKCEKSNAILAAKSPEIVEDLNSVSEHHVDEEEISDLNGESKEAPIEVDTAKCPECGSLRRCKHWAPLKTLICNFCQKAFTRKFNLKLHLKRHLGEKDWPCPKCGIRQLTQWLARRHCGPRPRRPCPVAGCDKSFTTNTNLNSHIRTHYGERPHACTECGKTFTTKNTLNDHLRTHTGVKPYMCPVCGRQFATNKLAAHLRAHAGAGHKAHACGSCARSFATHRALASHSLTHAPPARDHRCPRCPAAYQHPQSLRKHLRQRHAGARPSAVADVADA